MTSAESNHISHPDGFTATVNRQTLHFPDPLADARLLLSAADFSPADDCILVQVFAHGTRAIGLDETVDLCEPGIEAFWAFRTDRIYRFTVDERGFDWGDPMIKEPMLRSITHLADDEVIVFEREEQPDRVLGPDDELDLGATGTEHLRIKKRLVTVFFKDDPYRIPAGTYTTEELMTKFPIEEGYLLNLKTEDGELVTLKPGEKIHVKDGMHFYSQPPCGGSS
jgi:hypothetical protein